MFKKIIFLTCALSYINAKESFQLTQEETTIYNKAIKEYQQYRLSTSAQMDDFLTKNSLSAMQLYNVLNKKKYGLNALRNTMPLFGITPIGDSMTNLIIPKRQGAHPMEFALTVFIKTIIPALFSIPTLGIGIAIQQFATPSPTKNVISSSLIGIGGLFLTPAVLFTLGTTISSVEGPLRNLIAYPKQKQLEQINNEINIIGSIQRKLKEFYPNLIKSQPTYQ